MKKYRMDVVDGKLVITGPSIKVQKPVPQPVRVEAETPVSATKNECKQCKKKFAPKNLRGVPQTYCTVKCRTKYNNDKHYHNKVKHGGDSSQKLRECPQCSTKLEESQGRGQPKKFCTASCREKWFNNKYKQERKERLAKATVRTFHCRLCKKEAVKQKGNQVYCSLDCRESYYSNLNKRVLSEPVEKLHGVSYTVEPHSKVVRRSYTLSYKTCRRCDKEFAPTCGAQKTCLTCKNTPIIGVCKNPNCATPFQKKGQEEYCGVVCEEHTGKTTPKSGGKVTGAFVAKVKEALATLPPEETLPPPMPEDRSAKSLLSAGRTLTEVGLAEGVKDAYGVDIKDQPLRAKGFWFSILLAKHSKDLQDWRTRLEKHGLKSKPSVERWLLFQGASSTKASASGLKARLDI